ncbi:EIF(ISO)4G2, partial [Symbiodinium necroappetens]
MPGLLNKICPENVASIIEKIAAIEVQDIKQLEAIIELMFKKAITEPHYCETYADMVFSLKAVYPSFPSPDGGKPITFKGLVLNICQNEFEELLASNDISAEQKAKLDEEELEYMRKKRKDRMRANMKFIGHLFLRQLLSAKVIGSVICELVLCEQVDDLPEEHALECACELLLAIGYTMENMIAGQSALTSVCGRLKELMK